MKLTGDPQFRKNSYPGTYIAFEGIDGSGKTSQLAHLKEYFASRDKTVVETSEPNRELVIGKVIGEVLSNKEKILPTAMQYLMTADRVENHEKIIYPALKKGNVVLSHRSFWSNVPHGMLELDQATIDRETVYSILFSTGVLSTHFHFIKPDLTFYLKISAEIAVSRILKNRKVQELYEKKDKLARIMSGYEWQAQEFKNEFIVIDAERSEKEVAAQILEHIKQYEDKN
jgi:dTMP kinase